MGKSKPHRDAPLRLFEPPVVKLVVHILQPTAPGQLCDATTAHQGRLTLAEHVAGKIWAVSKPLVAAGVPEFPENGQTTSSFTYTSAMLAHKTLCAQE